MWSRHALARCTRHSRACAQLQSRALATVTDAAGPSSAASTPKPAPSKSSSAPKPAIQTAVILNRSPFLTRTPSPFETSYHAYQARVQRALSNPFPDEFYFRPGSILEGEFNAEEKHREKLAFGGPYVKDKPKQAAVDSEDAAGKPQGPMPRVHEADAKNDVKSLDRQGERNLYLLVHGQNAAGKDVWRFPQGGIEEGQALHQAAERDLYNECGELLDAWVVSRNPIGVIEPTTPDSSTAEPYVFVYKAHILAGQVQPNGKTTKDFAWLTKEEVESRVDKQYWAAVKDMLSDL